MNRNISIQLKALFLLIVFASNTVVGFACSVGADMGFNTIRHHDDDRKLVSVHVHADGKKHVHADGKKHDHPSQPVKHQHEEKKAEKKQKDGCCNDDVQKLQRLDKALSQNAKITMDAPVFIAIMRMYTGMDILSLSMAYPLKFKDRFFYPPPSDIRIAIQRFQI